LQYTGSGRPYYFSFDPSGSPRLLSHYGMESMELIDMETGVHKDVVHPGTLSSFSAPYWISDKEIVYVYKAQTPDEIESVKIICAQLQDPLTKEELEKLTKFDLLQMLAERSIPVTGKENNLVKKVFDEVVSKYQFCAEYVLAELEVEDVEVDFVASPNAEFLAFSDGSLYLLDIAKKRENQDYTAELIHERVMAFFWSPNSRYLLFCTVLKLDLFPHFCTWHIYDTRLKQAYRLADFTASAEFRQHYLPYFCQYALSLTFFSPDSRYFVYCSDKTVYVCGVEQHSTPQQLCPGSFATWSPCSRDHLQFQFL